MSEIKVNSIKGVSASVAALSINNTDGTCTVNNTKRQGKNLVVNGDFRVAQRGTSSTSDGYHTVDRFYHDSANNDESPTFAQVDVNSSDAGENPYAKGFTKAFKITNGNQTSGAQTNSYARVSTVLEAAELRNSGWNYTSSSSKITLSFYVKASVAQNYYGMMFTQDGTPQSMSFETGTLTANTWKKVTVTVGGATNIQFDDNFKQGFYIYWWAYNGTAYTASSGNNFGSFGTYNSSARTPDNATGWWTTNDSTFELTGIQLEVGDHATDFDHESFQETLMKCRRYCFAIQATDAPLGGGGAVTMSGNDGYIAYGQAVNGANPIVTQIFYPPMRTTPSLSDSGNQFKFWRGHAADIAATGSGIFTESVGCSPMHFRYGIHSGGGMTNGEAGILTFNGSGGYIIFSAEL